MSWARLAPPVSQAAYDWPLATAYDCPTATARLLLLAFCCRPLLPAYCCLPSSAAHYRLPTTGLILLAVLAAYSYSWLPKTGR